VDKPPGIPVSDSDWEQTPLSVQVLVVSLLKSQEQLQSQLQGSLQRIQMLERQVAELQADRRRGRGTEASGLDDSGSPAQAATSSRKRRPSGRSAGAQPGHEGRGRSLLSVDQVDDLVPVKPSGCCHCGHVLVGDDPGPQRHQVIEIPPVRPHVTEYQLHTLRCPHCQRLTQAELPGNVPRTPFGPSVHAWGSLLSGAYRISKRNVSALLSDAFGLQISPGAVSRMERRVSEALASPMAEAFEYVRQQSAAHLDETGWRERRQKAWLWTAVTELVTVFAIRLHRGREVARELLGDDTTAIVGSDRYTAYSYLPVEQRQTCWAHLERTFEKFVERRGEAGQIGQALLEDTHQLFTWWHRVRDGTLKRSSFRTYVSGLRRQVRFQLNWGMLFADPKTARTCANVRAIEPALWTFTRCEGVEPTNNAAEQALRHGVLWRKGSFGTHSPEGSRFVERMLTVQETLRKQKRDVLAYLTAACQASLHQRPAPSLLPTSTSTHR
jgi:transposase